MTDKITATKILRQSLNERNVKWHPSDSRLSEDVITYWCVGPIQWTAIEGEKGLWLNAGIAEYEPLTPEQTIEVTLDNNDELDEETMVILHDKLNAAMIALERANGDTKMRINAVSDAHAVLAAAEEMRRGTCKLEQHGSLVDCPSMVCWSCSECGFGWHHSINDKQFSYCPNCGRRIQL